MKNILLTIVISFLLLISGRVVVAKEWHGIVPLKSTRADVERLLGDPHKRSESLSYYKLSKELVVIEFQTQTCDGELGKFGFGWNVTPGTVIGLGVIPRGIHRKEEYLSSGSFKVDDTYAFIYYTDDAAGMSVETYNSLVTLLEYYPSASEKRLQCPRIQECCFDLFPRFDEYAALPFNDEKARLDNFAIQLNAIGARGVIEVLGPSKESRAEHMKRAVRAKAYLIKKRGLEHERLILVEGRDATIPINRLSIYSIGGVGSRVYLRIE